MIVWSNLTERAWDELQRKGRLRASRRHTKVVSRRLRLDGRTDGTSVARSKAVEGCNADLGMAAVGEPCPTEAGPSGRRAPAERDPRRPSRAPGARATVCSCRISTCGTTSSITGTCRGPRRTARRSSGSWPVPACRPSAATTATRPITPDFAERSRRVGNASSTCRGLTQVTESSSP